MSSAYAKAPCINSPVRALIIDDEQSQTRPLKDILVREGFEVDIADKPEAADDLVGRNAYHLVVADILFENSPRSGDEFILTNFERIRDAEIIALTALSPSEIEHREELLRMDVTILQKAEHMKTLRNVAAQVHSERTGIAMVVPSLAPRFILEELQKMIVRWVESKEDPNKPGIVFRGQVYSPNDILEHIQQGTDVGVEHLRMLVNLIKYRLGLEDPVNEDD